MRRILRRLAVCTVVPVAAASLSVSAAFAQDTTGNADYPTTPIPTPEDPNQPPDSQPPPHPVPGPIVGDASTGIGMIRLLPNSQALDSIFDPDPNMPGPRQPLAEVGLGLATAEANSDAYLMQERSIAEASPVGLAVDGKTPRLPQFGLTQTSVTGHQQPVRTGLQAPANPLVNLGGLTGSVHAQWKRQLGPCVDPIADSRVSLANASVGNVLPDELSELLNDGSLLNIPEAMSAHSTVRLVDMPGTTNKAVRSTTRMQTGSIRLLEGTSHELRIDVASPPTLTATSTGNPHTSTVDYTAPVIRISKGGEVLGVVDAANPRIDVPLNLDLGILRLDIGKLTQQQNGAEARGSARMFDLKILPGEHNGYSTSLADISFGRQIVRAGAPAGGVDCGIAAAASPAMAVPQEDPPVAEGTQDNPPAAEGPQAIGPQAEQAHYSAPLLWFATAFLVGGAVLLAAFTRRRVRPEH